MDSPKHHSIDRRNQCLQKFKEHNSDMLTRYGNHLPIQQARENQETLQILQRIRNQPNTKANLKAKHYDIHKQLVNTTGEQTNNTTNLNGGFNNNNEMLQTTAQKRPYEQFNGTNKATEDSLIKASRMADAKKQYQNMRTSSNGPFDMNPNVQPNVNPFQHGTTLDPALSTSVTKTSSTVNVSTPSLSISETMMPDANISDVLGDGLKKIEKVPNVTHVKTESTTLASSCNPVSFNSQGKLEPNSTNVTDYTQHPNETLGSFGDLDDIGNFALFGEITGNTRKNVKIESQPVSETDAKMNTIMISSEQKNVSQANPQNWRTSLANTENQPNAKTSQSLNPLANLNQMASMQSSLNQQQQQQQQQNISPNSNQQQQQQQMNQNNRAMNLNMTSQQFLNLKKLNANTKANQQLNAVSSPLGMMQSKNPLSPVNRMTSLNNAVPSPMTASNISSVQGIIPPNLHRPSNLRQQLADRLNKQQQQQQQSNMMPAMTYMQNRSLPTAQEKLQEHLKRKEQLRQIQFQQQHQMSKNQYLSPHVISPMQNTMQQTNPFQFPSDFNTYNQQKVYEQMGMQSQQNSGMGFYPPPYQMDGGPSPQMFPSNAPPGYSQQTRATAMIRSIMRGQQQQQMNDIYNSSMNNGRQAMNQQAMFNSVTKAPPQYPNQAMNPQGMDPQQMMLNANNGMQSASRLSHFSQPDGGSIGMSGLAGMNPAQLRMRGPMNSLNRYPAPPALSPSVNMTGNENLNVADNSQFGNFNNSQLNPSMIGLNQNSLNYNQNWTNEQQQLMYIKQRRLAAQQRRLANLQQQNSMQQRTENFSSVNMIPDNNKSLNNSLNLDISLNFNTNTQTLNNQTLNNQTLNNQTFQQQQQQTLQQQHQRNVQQQQQQQRNLTSNQSVKNVMNDTSKNQQASKQPPNLSNLPSTDSTDNADLDDILKNPPEHFDLLKMFS